MSPDSPHRCPCPWTIIAFTLSIGVLSMGLTWIGNHLSPHTSPPTHRSTSA